MITFPRAPRVQTGDPIRSTDMAGLADAFNARLRSGIGDGAWRMAFYALALWRQVRNPQDEYVWPTNAEFFEAYQGLPDNAGEWPVAGPGEPEGANLSNPMMAYVFGSELFNLYDEATRLTDPDYGGLLIDTPAGEEPEAWRLWQLRKYQCGAWDPATGAIACPAFIAARSYAAIWYSRYSPHGNSYGGFQAGPDVAPTPCDLPDGWDIPPTNYLIKFSAIPSGSAPDIEYPGTCVATSTEPYEGHVAGIVYTPWSYYVILNGATAGTYTVQELPTDSWIEGPYTGNARLRKSHGDLLERTMWEFLRGWRGAEGSQIPNKQDGGPPAGCPPRTWLSCAFDFQRFFTEQYALAPAYGSQVEDTVIPIPAVFEMRPGDYTQGQQIGAMTVAEQCVVHGAMMAGANLTSSCAVDVKTGSRVLCRLAVSGGDDAQTKWFGGPNEKVSAGETIVIEAAQNCHVPAGGLVTIELAHSMAYLPQLWDAFLVTRLAGARMIL